MYNSVSPSQESHPVNRGLIPTTMLREREGTDGYIVGGDVGLGASEEIEGICTEWVRNRGTDESSEELGGWPVRNEWLTLDHIPRKPRPEPGGRCHAMTEECPPKQSVLRISASGSNSASGKAGLLGMYA